MKQLFVIILALFTTSLTTAQIDRDSNIPVDEDVRIGTLDNGLKYYVQHNNKPEDKVELRLAVNAGSMQEEEDQRGLAHFMEHMNFNGTTHFEKNELVDYLQSIGVKFGAHLNAYTSFDETVYMLDVPTVDPAKVDTAMQVLEDWAHNALITKEEIDKERGVVMEEYRLGLGPDKRMRKEYFPLMLYKSRYAKRLPIGKKEVILNSDYDAVRRFYQDWYRPNLMAVIAVGDIDAGAMEDHIRKQFSGLENPKKPRERKQYEIPNHDQTFISVQNDPEASNTTVRITYKDSTPAVPEETVGDFEKELKRSLFTQMINNRFQELINSDDPPFTFGGSYYGNFYSKNKNAYRSYAYPPEDGIERAIRVLLEENNRVKQHGFTNAEFERAKTDIIARLEKQYQGRNDRENGRITRQYVSNFLENKPIPSIEWRLDKTRDLLPQINRKDVDALVDNYVHQNNRVIVVTGPEKKGLQYPSKNDIRSILKAVDQMHTDPYREEKVPGQLMASIPGGGSITDSSYNQILKVHTLNLNNGVKVHFKKTDFKKDEVKFRAFSFGGTNLLSTQNYKRIDVGMRGLTEAGLNELSQNTMDKVMSGKIASANPFIRSYYEGMRGSARPVDMEEMFQLIHLNFTALNKNEKAYKAYAQKRASLYKNVMNRPTNYFYDTTGHYLNQHNPRYTGFPTAEHFEDMDYPYAYKIYKERFADANDFEFFFVGNFQEKQLKEYAKKYLATLPIKSGSEEATSHEFPLIEQGQTLTVNKGNAPKSYVRIIYDDYVDYDAHDDYLLQSLGELLTIKLTEILREQKSGVYGVGARGGISQLPKGEMNFSISFPCGPGNVDSLTQSALNEVEKIKERGPQAKDVRKVIKAQLLDIKKKQKENRFWLQSMVNAYRYGKNLENLIYPEKKINGLKASDLQETARKYLSEYRLISMLYPEKNVE